MSLSSGLANCFSSASFRSDASLLAFFLYSSNCTYAQVIRVFVHVGRQLADTCMWFRNTGIYALSRHWAGQAASHPKETAFFNVAETNEPRYRPTHVPYTRSGRASTKNTTLRFAINANFALTRYWLRNENRLPLICFHSLNKFHHRKEIKLILLDILSEISPGNESQITRTCSKYFRNEFIHLNLVEI